MLSPLECDKLATVSKKLFLLSRNSKCWVNASRSLELSRNIPSIREDCLSTARLRYDGVYFSKCSYVRVVGRGHSLTDNRTYVSVVYFRFLRFFPTGTGLMVTHPADLSSGEPRVPKKVINRILKSIQEESPEHQDEPVSPSDPRGWQSVTWKKEINDSVEFRYEDKAGDSWLGALKLSNFRWQPGGALDWSRYCYWRKKDIQSRREFEIVRLSQLLNEALSRHDNETAVRIINQQQLASHDDTFDLSNIPRDLIQEVELGPDHFPPFRFKPFASLSYLF